MVGPLIHCYILYPVTPSLKSDFFPPSINSCDISFNIPIFLWQFSVQRQEINLMFPIKQQLVLQRLKHLDKFSRQIAAQFPSSEIERVVQTLYWRHSLPWLFHLLRFTCQCKKIVSICSKCWMRLEIITW